MAVCWCLPWMRLLLLPGCVITTVLLLYFHSLLLLYFSPGVLDNIATNNALSINVRVTARSSGDIYRGPHHGVSREYKLNLSRRVHSEQVGVLMTFLSCGWLQTRRKQTTKGEEEEGGFIRRWQQKCLTGKTQRFRNFCR